MERDTLSQTFAALADPTRRAMLARLSRGEANVTELAEPFLGRMSLPAVTKHLQVLERAGLVTKRQDKQRRPCELNAETLKNAADWMEPYRALWEESFDRLGEYLQTVVAEQQAAASPTGAAASPVETRPEPPSAEPSPSMSPAKNSAAKKSKPKKRASKKPPGGPG